jgi:hypothetical protein
MMLDRKHASFQPANVGSNSIQVAVHNCVPTQAPHLLQRKFVMLDQRRDLLLVLFACLIHFRKGPCDSEKPPQPIKLDDGDERKGRGAARNNQQNLANDDIYV